MKKVFSTILGLAVLFSILSVPVVTQAVSSTSSAQELIATLQQQIADLKAKIDAYNVQLESLKKAQGEVKEATKEVKGTLQLIKQLRKGMSGDDVKILQELLATDSDIYPDGLITGYFGKLTEKAVRKLQKKLCLEEVGSVGPKTLWKINELLTEGAGSSGKVPPGLLRAPGVQKKFCTPITTTTTVPATTTTTTIPATTTTTTIPATTTTTTTSTTTTTTTTSTTTTTTEPPTTTTTL